MTSKLEASAPVLLELALYVFFGLAWALPFKNVFKGVGKADPDAPENQFRTARAPLGEIAEFHT